MDALNMEALKQQLLIGGILVIPVGEGVQYMHKITRQSVTSLPASPRESALATCSDMTWVKCSTDLNRNRGAVGPGRAGVDRSRLVDDSGQVEEPLGEGGLTGVDVGEDAQVE